MTTFTIDQTKCKKDGICAAVCPVGIIDIIKEQTFPRPTENSEELCISCGHCSAVCPHGALQLSGKDPTLYPSSKRTLLPTKEQLTQLLCGRRSTRVFKKKAVDRATIERIIHLSTYAPTARNSQLLQWLVIDSGEELTNLRQHTLDWMKSLVEKKDATAIAYGFADILQNSNEDNDIILRNAPGLVIIYAPSVYPYGMVDSTIAMTTFELAAYANSIGTCWAGFFMRAATEWEPLRNALQLPQGYNSATAMIFGYPKYTYSRLPERKKESIIWR